MLQKFGYTPEQQEAFEHYQQLIEEHKAEYRVFHRLRKDYGDDPESPEGIIALATAKKRLSKATIAINAAQAAFQALLRPKARSVEQQLEELYRTIQGLNLKSAIPIEQTREILREERAIQQAGESTSDIQKIKIKKAVNMATPEELALLEEHERATCAKLSNALGLSEEEAIASLEEDPYETPENKE